MRIFNNNYKEWLTYILIYFSLEEAPGVIAELQRFLDSEEKELIISREHPPRTIRIVIENDAKHDFP